jgi:inner membrane protein
VPSTPRDISIPGVDNITHSLVGAALAEIALPADAPPARRTLFLTVGIVAANLPDADLVYTGVTSAPLGYLLHHRGHTHTVVGLVAQALLLGALCWLPAVRRRCGAPDARLYLLLAAALLSHLVLDSWNSYGVHPFWPVDVRWFYGDAIYILEPWLWLPLGVAAALNTRRRRRAMVLGAALSLLPVVLAVMGMIPVIALVALAATRAAAVVAIRRLRPRVRSLVALGAMAMFVAAMFALREHVRGVLLAAPLPASDTRLVDLVLSPRPANPLCWSALAITSREDADEYLLSAMQVGVVNGACGEGSARVTPQGATVQSLSRLRALHARDCAVHAWLQFGRAPELGAGIIADARFGGADRPNFSTMPLSAGAEAARCPAHLTAWGRPREDLLRGGP